MTRLLPLWPFAFQFFATSVDWRLARLSFLFTVVIWVAKLRLDVVALEVILESIFFVIEIFIVHERILDLLLKGVAHVSLDPSGGYLGGGTPKEASEEDWIVFFDSGLAGDGSRGCGSEESGKGVGELHGA